MILYMHINSTNYYTMYDYTCLLCTVKGMQRLVSSISDRCINRCISSFKSTALDTTEQNCLNVCAMKNLKHADRIAIRFAEENQNYAQQQQQQQMGIRPPQ